MYRILLGIIGVIFSIPASLFRGFTIHLYWGWFVSGVTGVASPGTLVCTGILLLYGLFRGASYKNLDEVEEAAVSDPEDSLKLVFSNTILSLFLSAASIFFGWVLHLFA